MIFSLPLPALEAQDTRKVGREKEIVKCVIQTMVWGTVFCVVSGCATTQVREDLQGLGLAYKLKEMQTPRPNRAHILRVDLSAGKTQPVVVLPDDPDGDGPAEVALTSPLKLAAEGPVLAFVNTNPWDDIPDDAGEKNRHWYEGQPVDIHGLAATHGHIRSSAGTGNVPVWMNEKGRVFLGEAPEQAAVLEGMAGFGQLVREGNLVVQAEGPLHPRTAMGVNRDGTVLWLVVVDGRQPGFSEGMSERELGNLMLELGCWNAGNMDGGGSSVMGMRMANGRIQVINSPSDRSPSMPGVPKIRPLPMILTICERNSG